MNKIDETVNGYDYTQASTIQELSEKLNHFHTDLSDLIKSYRHDQLTVGMHPVLFIGLIILFGITMSLMTNATHQTVNSLHPRGFLHYWEYIVLAVICLAVFLYVANKSGFSINTIV